jgi:hypothetical protein
LLLGKAYVLEGKPSRAEEIFREALDRSSDRKQMSLWIAAAYQSLLGNLEQSGRTEKRSRPRGKPSKLHAEDRDALLRLGWALLRDDWWKKEQEAKGHRRRDRMPFTRSKHSSLKSSPAIPTIHSLTHSGARCSRPKGSSFWPASSPKRPGPCSEAEIFQGNRI